MSKPKRQQSQDQRKGQDYHHGNLRQSLIDTAVEMIAELGPEGVATRAVARRAGVSSSAPFRHFQSKRQLMTAIAEEGIGHLLELTADALSACQHDHPLHRLMAFASAYVTWFVEHPIHYRVVADRPRIDFDDSELLVAATTKIRNDMVEQIVEAKSKGYFKGLATEAVHLQLRALSYGLGRMYVDDHLREWDVASPDAAKQIIAILREALVTLSGRPKTARRMLSEY